MSCKIKGEFGFWFFIFEEPLVEGSIPSFETSGMINFKFIFFTWVLSTLSSISSSFISFISLNSLFLKGIILILFEGFKSFGWLFCFDLFSWDKSSCLGEAKKSSGNISLFIFTLFVSL